MSLCCRRPGIHPLPAMDGTWALSPGCASATGSVIPGGAQNPVDIPGDRRSSPKRTRLLLGFAHLLGMRPNYVAAIQFQPESPPGLDMIERHVMASDASVVV